MRKVKKIRSEDREASIGRRLHCVTAPRFRCGIGNSFSSHTLVFINPATVSKFLFNHIPKKNFFLGGAGFAHRRFITRTRFESPMTENTLFDRVQRLGSFPPLKKEAETASEMFFNYHSTMDDVHILRLP